MVCTGKCLLLRRMTFSTLTDNSQAALACCEATGKSIPYAKAQGTDGCDVKFSAHNNWYKRMNHLIIHHTFIENWELHVQYFFIFIC